MVGMLIFSASLPATRAAVASFPPLFLTSARAVIAALLAIACLLILRQPKPERRDAVPLTIVATGVVIGFPLLTALALQHISAAHSVVFVGLLPLATALFAVLRGGERPKPAFWLFSSVGSLTVAVYALQQSSGGTLVGDMLMLAAIVLCGFGYAEGGVLSRRLGGWQVISWSLLFALPMMIPIAVMTAPESWSGIPISAWIGFGYVSIFSMFLGFIFWYRGLALGTIAGIGQLQLLQPFFGLMLASLLLDEAIEWTMMASTLVVVLCVACARRHV